MLSLEKSKVNTLSLNRKGRLRSSNMKQIKINKAYPVILQLCEFKLPIKKARSLYHVSSEMREHFEFAASEERKCVAECHGEYNQDGTIKFQNQEDFEKFQSRTDELNNSDLEWDIEPIVLTDSDIGNQCISVSDIRDLEGFVIFE